MVALEAVLQAVKEQFQELYRDQLEQLILFGSQARRQAEADSDIDIAVILTGAVNPIQEIKKNNPWISDLCLETDTLINCLYLSREQYETKETPLIRNIKREGISV